MPGKCSRILPAIILPEALKLTSQADDQGSSRQWSKILQERVVHTHLFIQKILALKEYFDAIRSGFLDAITYLDIHKGITWRAGFKLCQIILTHHASRAHVGCPRARPVIEFQSKPQWRDAGYVAAVIQSSADIISEQAQIDFVGLQCKDCFRFRAVKPCSALRKIPAPEILHQDPAFRYRRLDPRHHRR